MLGYANMGSKASWFRICWQLTTQRFLALIWSPTHQSAPPTTLPSENSREKTVQYHSLVLTSEYATPASNTYAIAFSAGLNGLQSNVD